MKNDRALAAPPLDFRALFQSAPDAYLVLDRDFRIVGVSDAYLAATMTQREAIVGRDLFEVFPDNPDDPEATGTRNLRASLESVLSTGKPHTMALQKYDIRRPQSEGGGFEERYWSPVNSPLFTGGELTHIIHRVEDVTDVVRMRQLQSTTEERARYGEEVFRLLVDSVQDYAIFMLDADGRVATWNSGAERIMQYRPQEILGKDLATFYLPEDVEAGKPQLELTTAIRDGRFEEEGWRLRKDGSRFRADVVLTPMFDEERVLHGFAKVTRDITAKKEGEETQRDLREQRESRLLAENANREKEEFIAVVSHELRTPMTSILGWARMLGLGGLDDELRKEALDSIQRSAKAQAQIIEDLLDESRIASGRLRLDLRSVDFRTVVEDAVTMIRPQAHAKNIALSLEIADDRFEIFGDPLRLQQVVSNVLGNAVKFTPEDGRISVSLQRDGQCAMLRVRDSGRGIDPALLPHVFDRFRKGESATSDRESGLGLGLSITRHLLELHAGTVDASSDGESRGAVFTIRLPLHDVPADDFIARDNAARAQRLPELAGMKVVIVEDDVDNRKVLAAALKKCGADVQCAGTAASAFERIGEWKPDVLICDIALPDLDGCSFLEKLRSGEYANVPPALALTVLGRPAEQSRIQAAGFAAFRQKPIDPIDLAHEVARLGGREPSK